MTAIRAGLAAVLLCAAPAIQGQVVESLCASGCKYRLNELQRAVDEAAPGTILEIDGVATTATGLVLRKKPNPEGLWITLRSAHLSNLPPDTRVSHSDPNLATITYTVLHYPLMTAARGASHYRFEGIRFIPPRNDYVYNLISFGTVVNGALVDHEVADLAHDIEFDRCVFTGNEGEDGPYRAVMANSGRLTITNSVFREIKGVNSEAQAVAGWNGPGPFYFRNNRFEASSIQTLFGGAPPPIRGMRATDLYFGGNHYYKPWRWRLSRGTADPQPPCLWDANGGEYYINRAGGTLWNCREGQWTTVTENEMAEQVIRRYRSGAGNPTFPCPENNATYKNTANPDNPYWICTTSGGWTQPSYGEWAANSFSAFWQKNQFELKNADRALVEGNILENGWYPGAQGQAGSAFLFNQVDNESYYAAAGRGEPSAVVSNVVVRHNIARRTPWGVSNGVIGRYYLPVHNIRIENNVFSPLGDEPESGGVAGFIQFGAQGAYSLLYNTVISSRASRGQTVEMYTKIPEQQIVIAGNILPYMNWGFRNDTGAGNLRHAVDTSMNPNRSLSKNVIVDHQGTGAVRENLLTPAYGTGLIACPSCANVRYFDNGGINDVGFEAFPARRYRLAPGSPYGNLWAHGRPAGADMAAVEAATETAVSGLPNPYLDFKVRRLLTGAAGAQMRYTAYDAAACDVTVSDRPDYANPAFTAIDEGGDRDRAIEMNGLKPAQRYFYEIRCGAYRRSGTFITALPIPPE